MLKITWTWKCDVCGLERVVDHDYKLQEMICRYYDLPSGWHYANGKEICDNHQIEVDPPPKTELEKWYGTNK